MEDSAKPPTHRMQRRRVLELGLKGLVAGTVGLALQGASGATASQAGRAYVFLIRDALPFNIGHVAVGVQGSTGRYVYMSKDGPGNTQHGGASDNGFWVRGGNEPDMLNTMQGFGYREYATVLVSNADTGAASRAAGNQIPGYWLFGDNCLDLTYQTLNGYGAPGLPSVQDWEYAIPSVWFDSLSSDWSYGGWA